MPGEALVAWVQSILLRAQQPCEYHLHLDWGWGFYVRTGPVFDAVGLIGFPLEISDPPEWMVGIDDGA